MTLKTFMTFKTFITPTKTPVRCAAAISLLLSAACLSQISHAHAHEADRAAASDKTDRAELAKSAKSVSHIIAMPSASQPASTAQDISVALLLASDKTVLGNDFHYPAGKAKMTAAIVTIAPGAETGWHRHDAPLFGYVLEGAVTLDYGAHGIKHFRAGESLVEAFNIRHNGQNKGSTPVRILTVYAGSDQSANSIADKADDIDK